jgi:hypothetical protein
MYWFAKSFGHGGVSYANFLFSMELIHKLASGALEGQNYVETIMSDATYLMQIPE